MFKVLKLEGDFYGVFIINSADESDRYLLTSPLKKHEAQHFLDEFNRIYLCSVSNVKSTIT